MERFWNKVEKSDGCWNWIGSKRVGYGAFKINGKVTGAHRYSFELKNGKIPDGMIICHSCDNPSCVNPDHLFLGSHRDNTIDAFNKGRRVGSGRSITMEKAIELKNILKSRSCTIKSISEQYGVSYNVLKDINKGRAYNQRA